MKFAIEMVSNGYCCGVDMWLTFSTKMSFFTCTCGVFGFVVEENISWLQKIFCYICSSQTMFFS
jgi:hypothetical protein